MSDQRETTELEQLEKLILNIKGLEMNGDRKNALKERILMKVGRVCEEDSAKAPSTVLSKNFGSLIMAIRKVVSLVRLGVVEKTVLKERIFALVDESSQKRFFFSNFLTFSRKLASIAMVFVLVFGFLTFWTVQTGVVRAATFTTLDSFDGIVLIKRGSGFVLARGGMNLKEGDRVVTANSSGAVIRYFDDSVSRLASDTDIVINKLYNPEDASVSSYVEVSLKNGAVWSKVLNLVEENSSFVVKAVSTTASARRAAFNVELHGNMVEVGVFNHTVDFSAGESVDKVMSGEKVVVDASSNGVGQKTKLNNKEKRAEWVSSNLESDRRYVNEVEERFLAAKLNALGIEKTSDVSFDKSLGENTVLLLTFDNVKQAQIELDLAERNFIAAQVKLTDVNLNEEERTDAESKFDEFEREMNEFYQLIDDVSATDQGYADELRVYAEGKIMTHKKDLSVVLPDSPVYKARQMVDALEFLVAEDDAEIASIKNSQAAEKLAVAEEVVGRGDLGLASEILDDYKNDVTDAITMIDSLSEESDGKEKLVENIAENIGLLDTVSELSIAVDEVKSEVVELAKEAGMEDVNGGIPAAKEGGIALGAVGDGSDGGGSGSGSESEDGNENEIANPEPKSERLIDGPFGIKIKGDKPLSPLLQEIE
jgi:hypothetical protein